MNAPEALKQYRSERKVTQHALAEALDVGQSTIAGWETGHRPISAALVGKVSALTGIPLNVLRPDLFPQPAAA